MLIHDFDMLVYMLGTQVPESIAAFGHAYDPKIKETPRFRHGVGINKVS